MLNYKALLYCYFFRDLRNPTFHRLRRVVHYCIQIHTDSHTDSRITLLCTVLEIMLTALRGWKFNHWSGRGWAAFDSVRCWWIHVSSIIFHCAYYMDKVHSSVCTTMIIEVLWNIRKFTTLIF